MCAFMGVSDVVAWKRDGPVSVRYISHACVAVAARLSGQHLVTYY